LHGTVDAMPVVSSPMPHSSNSLPARRVHIGRHRSLQRLGLSAAVALTLVLSSCSGGSSSGNDGSASDTVPPTAETPTYVDPAVPISSPIGREFDIMLPADPGSGWRWVLAPIDNARLIALGSRFSDDPALLIKAETATTTTTVTSTTRPSAGSSSSTSTTVLPPPVLPLVQVISFAGRSVGPTVITFRYTQIAGTPQTENRVLTFTVDITNPPPTTSSTTTSEPPTATTR